MPALTRTELFNFEETVLSASLEILTADGITSVPIQRDSDILTSPRVELQVIMGGPIGHVYRTGSYADFDAYNGQLNAIVVTDRTNSPSSHQSYVGKVRNLLGDYRNFNSGSMMPYHTMVRCDNRSSAVQVDGVENKDLTILAYEFVVWIKNDAWPT